MSDITIFFIVWFLCWIPNMLILRYLVPLEMKENKIKITVEDALYCFGYGLLGILAYILYLVYVGYSKIKVSNWLLTLLKKELF